MKPDRIFQKKHLAYATIHSGIYWLYKQTESGLDVTYVGISKNIRRRLLEHQRTKNFDAFFYEEIDYTLAKEREKFLLEGYKVGRGCLPLLNKQVG
jgi:excinuclease UvrABC nuclease subunit